MSSRRIIVVSVVYSRWSSKVSAFCASFMLCLPMIAAGRSDIVDALQPFVERHELAGAVAMIVSKDQTLAIEALGYSDIAAQKPMQTDSVFWIASMSKPILATAVMVLVDEGKLRLDDPVTRYLPSFAPLVMTPTPDRLSVRLQKPQHRITVRQLLNHTSGIAYSSPIETTSLDELPLATRVKSYALGTLQFEPGTDFLYSNGGINTAARIVEAVSGMRYEAFLQKRFFDPLHMKDTTFWPTQAQLGRLAKAYRPNSSETDLEETPIETLHYPLDDRRRRYAVPAGGLFSTAEDLGRFCQMLLNGGLYEGKRYLSEGAIREMAYNQIDVVRVPRASRAWRTNVGYGLGWSIDISSGTFSHLGAYATNMSIDPLHGVATIWMVQHAGFLGNGRHSMRTFEQIAAKFTPQAAEKQ